MWRKVNSFGGNRSSKAHTDGVSSAAGFGDSQVGAAVASSSSATGRRLASSGQNPPPIAIASSSSSNAVVFTNNQTVDGTLGTNTKTSTSSHFRKSLSQHVLQPRTASSERRRRRRRKSRPRRTGVSCVGGGGDNMS